MAEKMRQTIYNWIKFTNCFPQTQS